MKKPRLAASVVLCGALLAIAACQAGAPTSPGPSLRPSPSVPASPSPASTPTPLPTAALSQAHLKYALLARFGPISWCDPDYYPVAHADEQLLAEQMLPDIQADTETYAAILDHLGIAGGTDLPADQKLAIYREWKLLNAVRLTPAEDGQFGFDLITETDVGLGRGVHSAGTIDARGTIDVQLTEDSFLTACPICLSRGTLIDTPRGQVPVELLREGDAVWTIDSFGTRVAALLSRVGSTPVTSNHRVVHLVLDDGRELWVSPGHPLADGRILGELGTGDSVDGARVVTAELVTYAGGSTFDILPAGASGFYWANGVLLASTLR